MVSTAVVLALLVAPSTFGSDDLATTTLPHFDLTPWFLLVVALVALVAGAAAVVALGLRGRGSRRRTLELEQRLREHTAELEAVKKELEAFSYSASHDLRAPLRSIEGFGRILAEDFSDRLGDKGRRHIDRIRVATARMSEMIDGLLVLSRVTRRDFRRTEVDLSRLGEAVVDELRRSQPEREVEVLVAPGMVVEGDPHLLQIVLENLLGNAWKFSAKKEHARIELGRTVDDGEPAVFVRDNGAGFDMARADRLFQAFQRLHGLSEFEGSGIGLATVHRVVQRHGGRVWAQASEGEGATFFFTLAGSQ